MSVLKGARVFFITGKGGTGKSTVTAALGRQLAIAGKSTLIVEPASDGPLARALAGSTGITSPRRIEAKLDLVQIDQRQLVEEYFSELLRFSFLSKRLFASDTFNSLTAAAPGVAEFLLLEKLYSWAQDTRGQKRYKVILVDGPATGHVTKLLRTPKNLRNMAISGSLWNSANRLDAFLTNPLRTQVVTVSLAEEMSVRETLELSSSIAEGLQLSLARPIINRIFPRRFSAAEATRIEAHPDTGHNAVLAAACFSIARRREAERHVSQLRRSLQVSPILLRELAKARIGRDNLDSLGRRLMHGLIDQPRISQPRR